MLPSHRLTLQISVGGDLSQGSLQSRQLTGAAGCGALQELVFCIGANEALEAEMWDQPQMGTWAVSGWKNTHTHLALRGSGRWGVEAGREGLA